MDYKLMIQFFRVNFRLFFLIIAPICLLPIIFIGTAAARCAYCILLMSSYWVVEVFPLGVTAFLPIIVLPILGVITIRETSTAYMNDTNFLFMSSMLIALAVEDCGLHRRVALRFLLHVGAKPQWLMFGFMVITSFISLWISDTATAALMAPIAYALLETIMVPRMKKRKGSYGVNTESIGASLAVESLDVKRLSKRDRGICKAMMLIVAHASLIGGTGTINATGPNLIFRQTLYERYPPEETGVTYLTWMAFQVPPMILYMISSWLIVQIQFIGFEYIFRIFKEPTEAEREEEKRTRSAVKKAYDELGPMSFAEKSCLFLFLLTIFLWITCDPKVFPGWMNLFKKGYVSDALAGILISVLMFVWPKEKPAIFDPNRSREEAFNEKILSRGGLLTWSRVSQRFQWSIILLLGAGFAISRSVKMSGLAGWIACQIDTHLSQLPHLWMQVFLSIIVVTMTEFSTNTSTASIFIPIAFNVAEKVGAHPLYFAIPCAIGPSFSFMLPMATSSNAIVYETKTVSIIDMASCGIFLNVFCIIFTVLNLNTWAYWLFDMGTFPAYALNGSINNTIAFC